MSSPGMDSDGPKQPTARQMEILTLIMKNLNSKVDVDWEAVATQASLKNVNVAKEIYRQMQKKLGWSNTKASASATSGGSATPTSKVTKRTGKVGDSATKRGRGRPKKVKEVVDEDDEDGDASGSAKPRGKTVVKEDDDDEDDDEGI